MYYSFTFIYCFIIIIIQIWTHEIKDSNYRLVIKPEGHVLPESGIPVIFKRVDTSLNLTCRLETKDADDQLNYNISWNWQYGNNANRVMNMSLSRNEANLVFTSLKETDSGEYTCKCLDLQLSQNIRVRVKSMKKYCSEKNFMCSNGYSCIGRTFVCDGRVDCKDGSDEMVDICGANACEGKLACEDGRCIPTAWCCDEMHDPNCTVKNKPKCCMNLMKPYPSWSDADQVLFSEQHYNELGFLQTTIYTVIGCAMAFMFIVTILVIAICRVHIKRTIVSRCPLNHQHLRPSSPLRPTLPLYDFDMLLDRHTDPVNHPGQLLVTYNINNGVQFVGRPVDPPPYCEFIEMPPREGPPPPYVSRENISQSNENRDTRPALTNQNSNADVAEVSESVECECSESRENDINLSTNDNTQQTTSDEVCSSSPSVSGINNTNNSNQVFNDSSDSESDSMESDALLTEATIEKDSKVDEGIKVIRSSSLTANISFSPPNSFINNITAVSKTLIGSLKRQNDDKLKNKQLKTQKSFDSSEPCDIKHSNAESENFKVTHSVGDLSPVSADIERLDFLTLPLRESFIGVRNDEV